MYKQGIALAEKWIRLARRIEKALKRRDGTTGDPSQALSDLQSIAERLGLPATEPNQRGRYLRPRDLELMEAGIRHRFSIAREHDEEIEKLAVREADPEIVLYQVLGELDRRLGWKGKGDTVAEAMMRLVLFPGGFDQLLQSLSSDAGIMVRRMRILPELRGLTVSERVLKLKQVSESQYNVFVRDFFQVVVEEGARTRPAASELYAVNFGKTITKDSDELWGWAEQKGLVSASWVDVLDLSISDLSLRPCVFKVTTPSPLNAWGEKGLLTGARALYGDEENALWQEGVLPPAWWHLFRPIGT